MRTVFSAIQASSSLKSENVGIRLEGPSNVRNFSNTVHCKTKEHNHKVSKIKQWSLLASKGKTIQSYRMVCNVWKSPPNGESTKFLNTWSRGIQLAFYHHRKRKLREMNIVSSASPRLSSPLREAPPSWWSSRWLSYHRVCVCVHIFLKAENTLGNCVRAVYLVKPTFWMSIRNVYKYKLWETRYKCVNK